MNKILKIALAVLGAVNEVMTIFIPIIVILMLINVSNTPIGGSSATLLITAGILSSLFRGLRVWIK